MCVLILIIIAIMYILERCGRGSMGVAQCTRFHVRTKEAMDATLVVSRVLSYSVIAMCFFMKLPQIRALYNARSSRGISARAYWMEIAWWVAFT